MRQGDVTLVAMPPSGEVFIARDGDALWLVPPPGAGGPQRIDAETAARAVGDHGFDLIEESFASWAELDTERQRRAGIGLAAVKIDVERFDAEDVSRPAASAGALPPARPDGSGASRRPSPARSAGRAARRRAVRERPGVPARARRRACLAAGADRRSTAAGSTRAPEARGVAAGASAPVTFYSYKGGTGRTLLLANIAILAARMGRKVVAIDVDLEAQASRAARRAVDALRRARRLAARPLREWRGAAAAWRLADRRPGRRSLRRRRLAEAHAAGRNPSLNYFQDLTGTGA